MFQDPNHHHYYPDDHPNHNHNHSHDNDYHDDAHNNYDVSYIADLSEFRHSPCPGPLAKLDLVPAGRM